MRILFLTSGRDVPSSRFRVLQYVPYLEQRGHACAVAGSIPPKYRGWRWLGNRLSDAPRAVFRTRDLLRAAWSRFDVIVIERELFSSGFSFFERCFRRIAPRLVLDVDDGIFLQHPDKFAKTAAMVDAVIAGNAAIAQQAEKHNPRTVVIPTSLDLGRYVNPLPRRDGNESDSLVLGWTGTAGNYPQLLSIADALGKLPQERHFQLRVIAESEPPAELASRTGLDVRFRPWNPETEIEDLCAIDIGLMPLPDDEWSRYKCGLKILQYLALGIPAIASPVGVNAEIITPGKNGLWASTDEEWIDGITQLAGDVDLRRRFATAGRATVEVSYSIEGNVPLLERTLRGDP